MENIDEEKIKKYNQIIYRCCIATLIFISVGVLTTIIKAITLRNYSIFKIWQYWFLVVISVVNYLNKAFLYRRMRDGNMRDAYVNFKVFIFKKFNNIYELYILNYILLILFTNVISYIIFACFIFYFHIGLAAYFVGYVINVGNICSVIITVCAIICICELRKYTVECKTKQREKEAELLERSNKIRQAEDARKQAENVIESIGRRFFVTYYEILKNWAIPDIADSIKENYTEETKQFKIGKAKWLFSAKQNIYALKFIVNYSVNKIDSDTLKKAQELLEKEQA